MSTPILVTTMSVRHLCVVGLVLLTLLAPTGTSSGITNRSSQSSVDGYELEEVTLPDFANLSTYTSNSHGNQYPTYDYAGLYASDIIYIDNSSRFAYYDPYSMAHGSLSEPVTLLYQKTNGTHHNQIDNEFQLDTPYDVALLYGNLTAAPGHVSVETVDLTTGTVHLVTTPVLMENNIQADYVGDGNVVIFNSTTSSGEPTYFANVDNETSWYSGLNVGIAADNIYWIWQLHSFVDIQGRMVSQFLVQNDKLVLAGRVWLNDSSVTSVSAVNGAVYAGSHLAFWESTNAGWDYLIVALSRGMVSQEGSYDYFSNYVMYVQRYSYTSPYVWAIDSSPPSVSGPTVLLNPFDNSTLPAPDLVTRQEGSGANSNFEFQDPYSPSTILSFNGTLVGNSRLNYDQFVWAYQPQPLEARDSSPLTSDLSLSLLVAPVLIVGLAVAIIERRGRAD